LALICILTHALWMGFQHQVVLTKFPFNFEGVGFFAEKDQGSFSHSTPAEKG